MLCVFLDIVHRCWVFGLRFFKQQVVGTCCWTEGSNRISIDKSTRSLAAFNLSKRGVWAAWLGQFATFHHNRPSWGYLEDFPGFNMRLPVKLPYAGEHVYIVYMTTCLKTTIMKSPEPSCKTSDIGFLHVMQICIVYNYILYNIHAYITTCFIPLKGLVPWYSPPLEFARILSNFPELLWTA